MTETKPRTELILIRHGQTRWNLEERSQGHGDSPLTEIGLQPADLVGRRLAGMAVDALSASDLGRAVDTAKAIGRHTGHAVQTDARLREQNFGVFDGMTVEERARKFPEVHAIWATKDPDYRIPGGESLRDRYDLVVGCLDELAAAHPGQRLVVVTHGGNLNAVLRHCMSMPLNAARPFVLKNASLNIFRVTDGAWKLVTWGDVGHLASD